MARKRKQIDFNPWTPMIIDFPNGFTAEDFQGLIALEELNDYKIINDDLLKKEKLNIGENDPKRKNKKLKKINQFQIVKVDKLQDEIDEISSMNWKDFDMSEWEKLPIPEHLIRCLRELRMLQPTPIQRSTIPSAIVERRNIYAAAPTGSGKTLAFAIPVVVHVANDKINKKDGLLKSIILTPTRELAVQIKKHIENICKYNEIQIALIVGGLAIQKQERVLLRKKPDIIVATPGRLWEIINDGTVPYLNKDSFVNIKYLVIDEADRMIEKTHFKELRSIINLLNESPLSRQIFIFSATLTMIKEKKNKLKKKESDSENLITLLNIDKNTLKICDLTECGTKSKPDSEQLKESIIHCFEDEKDLYLYYFVILNPGRTIIFCNSIDCIRRLLNIFRFLKLNPLAVHSSMPQKRRLINIERFTSTNNCLLFATDVAARGLDIRNVDHVIHYQVPRTVDTYIHRSGRTARLGSQGMSIILCDPKEEAFFLRDFSRIIKKETLSEYPVNSKILKRFKERIKLAQVCDNLEHKLRKNRTEENWFKTTAEACEIILDSDENDDNENNFSVREKNECQRKLKIYHKQLISLLQNPIKFPIH